MPAFTVSKQKNKLFYFFRYETSAHFLNLKHYLDLERPQSRKDCSYGIIRSRAPILLLLLVGLLSFGYTAFCFSFSIRGARAHAQTSPAIRAKSSSVVDLSAFIRIIPDNAAINSSSLPPFRVR